MCVSTAIILLSGGMDSAVLAYSLFSRGIRLKALTVLYGQKHAREVEFARNIAAQFNLEHRIVDLSAIKPLLSSSALTAEDQEIPSGHYTSETMKMTVVPNRNMIFLSLAAAWAISSRFDAIGYAAHAGDHAIYPDCRPEFANTMEAAIGLADWHSVKLLRPFMAMTKSQICEEGARLGVDFSATWSCYRGGALHCGLCGTCVERKEAFEMAGVSDPTNYQN